MNYMNNNRNKINTNSDNKNNNRNKVIFVGKLSKKITEKDLRDYFTFLKSEKSGLSIHARQTLSPNDQIYRNLVNSITNGKSYTTLKIVYGHLVLLI